MELISKVSKGSKMDQVYLPKNRNGFNIGDYVILKPLEEKKFIKKPYFYDVKNIEPIKLEIIKEIISIIDSLATNENIIISGSFLDKGFNFRDIDVIIIGEDKVDERYIKNSIENKIKIKTHIISLDNKTLIKGLSTDPLYQLLLSKCIAKKRFVYKLEYRINYKILDLHLLKSKLLIDSFDMLDGNEKYYLVRNIIAISLYLKKKKIDTEKVDKEIRKVFNLKSTNEIKQNILEKDKFLKKYKKIYENTFEKIMQGIKNAKQKKVD